VEFSVLHRRQLLFGVPGKKEGAAGGLEGRKAAPPEQRGTGRTMMR
jgi:hypothetical protein